MKGDIYDANEGIFAGKASIHYYNCMAITLILKIAHASQVKDFRPISCCFVVYKVVAKILAKRIQNVVPRLVS